MKDKQTNLCIAADFHTLKEVEELVHIAGPHICVLKTHHYYYSDCKDPKERARVLNGLKQKYNFLVFEDEKYDDGQEQTKVDYEQECVDYADLITVVPGFGPGVFKAIKEVAEKKQLVRGCLAVIQVSFEGALYNKLRREVYSSCLEYSDICVGVIAQDFQTDASMLKLSPGVHIAKSTDGRSQNWRHPTEAMSQMSDIIIVGRGITQCPKHVQLETLLKYKELGYESFKNEDRD